MPHLPAPQPGGISTSQHLWTTILLSAVLGNPLGLQAAEDATNQPEGKALETEATIPLGDIRGRIDHLAIDVPRQRLYVAELGNDTVGVLDLAERKAIRTLTGLKEPQGIAYVQPSDTVYIANAADGSVRLFRGADLAPAGQIALGSDADNVRVDEDGSRVFVGYGDGALAVIDAKTQQKVGEIPLKAHPESFRLERSGPRIFVNVPDAHAISIVDRRSNKEVASWQTGSLRANYPLALDDSGHVLAVFRQPARVAVFQANDGRLVSSFDTCGDSDDVFVDTKRHRLYVICGEGFIDTFAQDGDAFHRIARLATASGARTGLYSPDTDRLYLAVRATLGHPASIWVLRPIP
jgi:YVTN family beta-propeller protein